MLVAAPDGWTAEWREASGDAGETLRFRVEGTYRGAVPGTSEPDPIWDPGGANADYEVTSAAMEITG